MTHTDDQDGTGRDEMSVLAAELALGLLSSVEHREAVARLERDPAFALELARWEEHFAALADDVAPVPAPERVWRAIEAGIGAPAPAFRNEAARTGLWNSLAFWRGLSFVSLAGATAAGLFAFAVVTRPPAPEPLTAALTAAGGTTFMVSLDPGEGMLTVMPVSMGDAAARVPELWFVPEGGTPQSLGVMDAAGMSHHRIAEPMREHLREGATLAISLEPSGGSPTGQPTGPVVATGRLTDL